MRSFTLSLFTTMLALSACGDLPDVGTTLSTGTTGGSTGAETMASSNPTSASATEPNDTTTGGTTTGDTSNPTTGPTTGATTGEPGTTTTGPGTTVEPGTTGEPGTTTTDGTTDGTTGDGTTGGTTTTDGTTGGTTGAVDCAALAGNECMAEPACLAIGGGKLNLMKNCVGKPMFLDCVEAMACGDALTYGCDPTVDPPEPYLFKDTCLPAGWEPCEAPPIEMPCK